MAVSSGQVAVGTAPVIVFDASGDATRAIIRNQGTASVFIGGSGVTTGNGFELTSGSTLTLTSAQDSTDDFYAVAAVTGTVHRLVW